MGEYICGREGRCLAGAQLSTSWSVISFSLAQGRRIKSDIRPGLEQTPFPGHRCMGEVRKPRLELGKVLRVYQKGRKVSTRSVSMYMYIHNHRLNGTGLSLLKKISPRRTSNCSKQKGMAMTALLSHPSPS